jgi:hypothetical protein
MTDKRPSLGCVPIVIAFSTSTGFLGAESSAVKDDGSATLWFVLTGFALFLAAIAGTLALLARRAGKDSQYGKWKRSFSGLLVMALLSFTRALTLR